MKKRILFLLVVLNQFIFGFGYAPTYGPGADWTVLNSTQNAFIIFDDITFNGSAVETGEEFQVTGSCDGNNCDILGAIYNGACVGWTYMPIVNGGITLAIQLNDGLTPGIENYPAINAAFAPEVSFNFYDVSEGVMYYNVASSPLQTGVAYLYEDLNITGTGTVCSSDGFLFGPSTDYCLDALACNSSDSEFFDTIGDSDLDCCGIIDGGNANMDCNGDCFGSAVEDCNGTCDGGLVEDCNGICDGDAVEDDCGVCEGDDSSCADCLGIPNGTAVEDCNGTCDGGVVEDCNGICDGSASLDDCGVCGGGNADMDCNGDCFGSAVEDCNGICDGDAVEDDCGVCGGGNADMDCNGDCFGSAVMDDCGVCDGDGIPEGYCDCETTPVPGHDCEENCLDNDEDSICDVEQVVTFTYNLKPGANLIGFFGDEYFTSSSTLTDNNSVLTIFDDNIPDINFILGAGTALFPFDWNGNGEIEENDIGNVIGNDTLDFGDWNGDGEATDNEFASENISCYNDQWFAEDDTEYCYTFEGNLSTLARGRGYWVSTNSGQDTEIKFDGNSVDNCNEAFNELSSFNNLVAFYWDGNNHNIFDALGGIEYATDNFNHIVGAGKIRKNICGEDTQDENCWIGNLNTMISGAGYWLNLKDGTALSSGDEDFSWGFSNCSNPPEDGNLTKDDDFFKIPEEYQFIQSTEQAFYVINGIDGANTGDIITAQCGDKLVGTAFWDGQFTAIPVMGRDFNEQTEGNCEIDEVPMFILNKSTGIKEHILIEDIPGFVNSGIFIIEKLESIDNNFVPNEILLSPAYPNPFNPVTNISYGLPLETHITLNIYNVEGSKITTLAEGIRSAGIHSFEWSAEGYPSGVYFVKLNAGGFTQTQKLMLVK